MLATSQSASGRFAEPPQQLPSSPPKRQREDYNTTKDERLSTFILTRASRIVLLVSGCVCIFICFCFCICVCICIWALGLRLSAPSSRRNARNVLLLRNTMGCHGRAVLTQTSARPSPRPLDLLLCISQYLRSPRLLTAHDLLSSHAEHVLSAPALHRQYSSLVPLTAR